MQGMGRILDSKFIHCVCQGERVAVDPVDLFIPPLLNTVRAKHPVKSQRAIVCSSLHFGLTPSLTLNLSQVIEAS